MQVFGEELPELTAEQEAALRYYAASHGRTWKSQLREDWMRAVAIGPVHALRNSHGPSWLQRYKLPTDYTVRKSGDNYVLCFRGLPVESGLFASRETAIKHKQIAENDRRQAIARISK